MGVPVFPHAAQQQKGVPSGANPAEARMPPEKKEGLPTNAIVVCK